MSARHKIIFAAIIILVASCLNPPRDNDFDPNNPNKASLVGYVGSPEGKVRNAKVKLFAIEHDLYDSTYSDEEGKYKFMELDPGIYKLMAFTPYYLPAEYFPESLPAGAYDTVELYFSANIFNFDNDTINTIEPFDFQRIAGNWRVMDDNTAPSQPHVYNCQGPYGLALYSRTVTDFCIQAEFKISTPVDTVTQVGVVVRLQDSLNYYLVAVAKEMLFFCKVKNGLLDVLQQTQILVNQNEWSTIYVDVCEDNFKIYFNGDLKIEKADTEFNIGKTGLWAERVSGLNVSVSFDDIIIYR